MAEKKTPTKAAETFTAEERAAMKARAKELKSREDGGTALREAIAQMPPTDRILAARVDAIVTASAPSLLPKTWYGMPAYANQDGKVVCFFKPAHKFKSRYATLGFEDAANLDDGGMWVTSFALTELTAADEKKIAALVRKAVS